MRSRAWLVLLGLLASGCPAPRAEPPRLSEPGGQPDLTEVASRVVDSVVSVGIWSETGEPVMDAGSGVVVADGVVLTNHHVVATATRIQVSDRLGTPYAASIAGTDEMVDLAVIRVHGTGSSLRPLPFGDSSAVRLGEWVLAVGSPFGLGSTVTVGIISAKGRAKLGIVAEEDFLQTDAAINPGNSGGALVNARGELIGINTAILSRSGGSQGIGFAIPANMAQRVMQGILKDGRFRRGWLGAEVQERELGHSQEDRRPGLLVTEVDPNSPAARGGLAVGDIILAVDGDEVFSSRRLRTIVLSKGAGQQVRFAVKRNEANLTLTIVLEESAPRE